jgi:hypothetical protein
VLAGAGYQYALIVMLATSMGIQNATARESEVASPKACLSMVTTSGRWIRQARQRLGHRLAATDNYVLVLLLIALSILLMAVTDIAPVGRIVALVLVGGTLVYALQTSGFVRLVRLASVVIACMVGVAILAVVLTGRVRPAGGIETAVAGVLVASTSTVIARRLVRHSAVNTSTIAGALCIYLLIGLFFAFLYSFTEQVGLDPFFSSKSRATDVDYLYFSFSTLATVGFGDLVAGTNLGRMLVVIEALVGQMYLVTIVALLVGRFCGG